MKTVLSEISATLVLALVIFLLLQTTVQSFVVFGCSMEPNFHEGERLLINKAVYHLHEPQRGDVIVFQSPNKGQVDYIKRVIALPGETIEVKEGSVYIDGDRLVEDHIKESPKYTLTPKKIPENEYFVLGDNRNNSNDSHNGWTVPEDNIIGKVWLSIWPPSEWGVVPSYSLQERQITYKQLPLLGAG